MKIKPTEGWIVNRVMKPEKLFAALILATSQFLYGTACEAETAAVFTQPTALVETITVENYQLSEGAVTFIPCSYQTPDNGEWVEVSGRVECTTGANVKECERRAIVDSLVAIFDSERFPNLQEVSAFTGVNDSQTDSDRIILKRAILVHPDVDLLSSQYRDNWYEVELRARISAVDPSEIRPGAPSDFQDAERRIGSLPARRGMTGWSVQRTMSRMGATLRGVIWSRSHIINWD